MFELMPTSAFIQRLNRAGSPSPGRATHRSSPATTTWWCPRHLGHHQRARRREHHHPGPLQQRLLRPPVDRVEPQRGALRVEGARPVVRPATAVHTGLPGVRRHARYSDPARYQRTAAQLIEGRNSAGPTRVPLESVVVAAAAVGIRLLSRHARLGPGNLRVALAAVSAVPRAVAPEPVDDHRRIRGLCDRRPGLGADRRTISDAVGRKPVLLVALSIILVGLAVFLIADHAWQLVLARLLHGVAVGALTVVAGAALSTSDRTTVRATVWPAASHSTPGWQSRCSRSP